MPVQPSGSASWCKLLACVPALVLAPGWSPIRAGDGVPRDPVVYLIHGEYGDQLGVNLAVVGDVDKDGAPDFAATLIDPQPEDAHPQRPGRVDLFSGRTGTLIRTFVGTGENDGMGWSALAAFPDLDEDGVLELGASVFLVGTKVFSPVTGETWYTLDTTSDLNSADTAFFITSDIDKDGIAEVISGGGGQQPLPYLEDCGQVQCWSGRTGELIWTRWGSKRGGEMGRVLCGAGDHDADSVPDVLTVETVREAPSRDRLYEYETVVHVLSGKDGRTIRTYTPPLPRLFAFGERIVSLGDRDLDGFPEVAIAAPFFRLSDKAEYPRFPHNKEGGFFTGWIGVLKLPEFKLLFSTHGRESTTLDVRSGDKLGLGLAPAGDVDGDGVIDFLAGTDRVTPTNPSQQGRLYVFSGLNGDALATYEGYIQLPVYFFHALSPLGDVDGDGRDEFLATNQFEIVYRDRKQLFHAGTIRALRFDPESPRYIRGDADGDGRVTVADAVAIARLATREYCSSGDTLPPNLPACPAAYDVDADGCIDRTDAMVLATYLFRPFELAPAPPFPGCGQHYHLDVDEDFAYLHLPCRDPGSCTEP